MPTTTRGPAAPRAERTQYRVGHGGFHSTIVTNTKQSKQESLVYVYDIGAAPSVKFARGAIENFITRLEALKITRVDFVILSHIDEDHVNCLKELLEKLSTAKIVVDKVVLPWLDTTEKLLAKARANHRAPSTVVMNLTGSDDQIAGYLAGLGAEGIVFLQPEEGAGTTLGDSAPALPRLPVTARFEASGSNLARAHAIPWELVAIRLNPPKGTIRNFTYKLQELTGLNPNNPANHKTLLTNHRSAVRSAMKAAAAGTGLTGYGHSLTNWSCISVFGSSPTPTGRHANPSGGPSHFTMTCDHGWLHTGDLPLHISDVWQAFESAWDQHVDTSELCALAAPHHGSQNGHNPKLYTKFQTKAALFTTGWSSRSKPGSPVYSKGNSPTIAMHDAGLSTTVFELNNY